MFDSIWSSAQEAFHSFRYGGSDYAFHDMPSERIAIVGSPGVGKHTLLSNLLGWSVTEMANEEHLSGQDFGLFVIVTPSTDVFGLDSAIYQLEDSTAIVYLLDAMAGPQPEDFQWIARLRQRKAAM